MNKYNTQPGQLLDEIKRPEFYKLAKDMNADRYCKTFTAWDQFVVLSFAQLSGQHGLRSIENALNSHYSSFYHLNIRKPVKHSTLSYADSHRDAAFFEALYYQTVERMSPFIRGAKKKEIYAIDATTISLCFTLFKWALFRNTKSGVKMHVKYDTEYGIPEFIAISNANKHENSTLKDMKLKKGDTVTFDLGYVNYKQFHQFCRNGIYFVTRLKDNAAYTVIADNPVPPTAGNIKSDELILLTGDKAMHDCPEFLRKITSTDHDTGKDITLLTDMKRKEDSAENISMIYRKRWQIELFFKAVKQNLRIERFYGNSENAVRTQVWISMIMYLLFLLLRIKTGCMNRNFTSFISEIKLVKFLFLSTGIYMHGSLFIFLL
ncbi:MAG TPA: IS4 family transposase [Treponema sp.]|nr:IS4 family transposase [Treponema sp.]